MTVAEIASRLDDSLRLLTLGARAAPPRQHSLRASLDWSYGLLQEPEQQLLRRLSALEAEFTVEAAEAVSAFDALQHADITLLLDRLVSQSLVQARQHESRMRFSLDVPMRQYAFERLEEAGEAGRFLIRDLPPVAPRLSPPRPTKPRGVLSERERDVVMLIAGGRSNREIADELVITKKTAEAHVSHILTKLGLGSRVQIATWSLQQGVTEPTAGP
jgi:DNA-binding CsgD family transcriptional regulator